MLTVAAGLSVLGRDRGAGVLAALGIVRANIAAWPETDRAVDRAVGRSAASVAHALGHGMLWLIAVGIITPVGAVSRALHPDSLRRFAGEGWQVAAREGANLGRPYNQVETRTGEATTPSRGGTRRWARLGAATVALLAITAIVQTLTRVDADASQPGRPPALLDQPQVDTMQREEGAVFADLRPDPELGWRLPTTAVGATVNVRDGHRTSTGSTAGAPVVWFFGGSAMWGSGQRDDHTLASDVARLATKDGTPVRVVNWGVFGYTSVQEVRAFRRALASHAAPDLVVFYDGYNDVSVGAGVVVEGLPAGSQVVAPLSVLKRGQVVHLGAGKPVHRVTDAATARSILQAYEASMTEARRLADAQGITMVQIWQPNAFTSSPPAADGAGLDRLGYSLDVRRALTRLHRSVAVALPPQVIDLSRVLQGAPDTFVDQVHTNERGARILAARMYRVLRADLIAARP